MARLSIVTPVRGRHSMIPALIECYSRFTGIDGAEWLVLDNSEEWHELPGFIRHVYVGSKPYSIGAMRNACAAIAQGDVIAHMDSDDYYAPEYMAESLEFLLASGKQVAGCHCILFWDCKAQQGYRYDAQLKPYACGASMIYFKAWQ